jgi:hypothetical protein
VASAKTICTRKTALLLPILLLIAIIQVLPQVDLPDTVDQLGAAPIIAKPRTASQQAFVAVIEIALVTPVRTVQVDRRKGSSMPSHPVNRSLPILFSTLLC